MQPNADLKKMTLGVEALRYEMKTHPATEGRIIDMLKGLFNNAKSVLSAGFGGKIDGVDMLAFKPTYAPDETYRKINPANFVDFANRKVSASEGFQGSYVAFGQLLDSQLDYYKNHLDESIQFYTAFLGHLINSREARASWDDITRRFVESGKYRDADDQESAKFYAASSHEAVVKIGQVISRVNDLNLIDDLAKKIRNKMDSIKLPAIQARVKTVNDLVGVLAKGLENKSIDNLTGAQVNNLATGVMELAFQVEHYALIYYRAAVYLRMVRDIQLAAKEVV